MTRQEIMVSVPRCDADGYVLYRETRYRCPDGGLRADPVLALMQWDGIPCRLPAAPDSSDTVGCDDNATEDQAKADIAEMFPGSTITRIED